MAMSEGGYQGGPTVETRWGCLAAAIVGAPIFFLLLVGDAMGDCAPGPGCKHGFLSRVLFPAVIIAVGVGLLVRWMVKAVRRNRP
jgi:hypothetical protein